MTVRSISAAQTRPLRHAVLRPDEPWEATAYRGDTTPETLHVGAFDDDQLVGVASVFPEAPPDEHDPRAWRLRGMATAPGARGRGHGAAMVRACIGHVARLGGWRVWCNARTPAADFYARHGFVRRSDVFVIPPIGPHVVMERPVKPSDTALALGPDPAAERVVTPRLVLRRWTHDDLDAFAAINADPETMEAIGPGRALSQEESARALRALMAHWEVHGFGLWAVTERGSGRLIGRAGLWHPPEWAEPEIGWLLARDRWGQGLATEAARAGLAYGFGHRHLDRVGSLIRPRNVASQRVAGRLGMRLEEVTTWRGNLVHRYVLTRAQWQARESPGNHTPPPGV